MRTIIKPYRSYSFKDKDPVIDELRTIIASEGVSYRKVHELSDVSEQTLYNWFSGPVRRPQYATVMAVVRSLGYEQRFVKRKGKPIK
jgi:hypothetical protein